MNAEESGASTEWRAKELKRRIQNRRNIPDSNVALDTKLLSITLLPQLLEVKHENHNIQMHYLECEAKNRNSMHYYDQHFKMEKNIRLLKSEIDEAQQHVRQKKETLSDLETKILRLSKSLKDNSEEKTFAKNQIEVENEIRHLQTSLIKCQICRKEYIPNVFELHLSKCKDKSDIFPNISLKNAQTNQENNKCSKCGIILTGVRAVQEHVRICKGIMGSVKLPLFLSQPPRNLHVDPSEVTHNNAIIRWDPPIFTGSQRVIDYEISMSVRRSPKPSQDESQPLHVEVLRPFLSSIWCLSNPIPLNQFLLTNLTADTSYCNVRIQAITKNGKSEYSNSIEVLKTLPPQAPSKPLFFSTGLVAATSITLHWLEPFDNGGCPIEDYEISFMEAFMEENVAFEKNVLDVSQVNYKLRRIRTCSAQTMIVISELLSGKTHKNFEIRAVNAAGIVGEPCDRIESVVTAVSGDEFKLLDELQAAVKSHSRIIDSKFLSGFMQRYERQYYVRLLSDFILQKHPSLQSKVEGILMLDKNLRIDPSSGGPNSYKEYNDTSLSEKSTEELTPQETIENELKKRRRQFKFRIAEIERDIKKAEYNVQWCKDRRIDLVSMIRAAELRILDKQAELERARMFKGSQMDSDVLESGLQRFYTKELKQALEEEIDIEQLYILDAKQEIVKVENFLRADEKRLRFLNDRLNDRKVALDHFEEAIDDRESNTKRITLMSLKDGSLYRVFQALVIHHKAQTHLKAHMKQILKRIASSKIRIAIEQWKQFVHFLKRLDLDNGGVFGVGSNALLDVTMHREDMKSEVQQLLGSLQKTNAALVELTQKKEQKMGLCNIEKIEKLKNDCIDQEARCAPLLMEGDSRMDLHDFEGALSCYNKILENEKWMVKINDHFLIQLLLKSGSAMLALNDVERALMNFNRADFLANRVGDWLSEGKAAQKIGEAFLALRSLKLSTDAFDRAIASYSAVGDRRGEMECYRGLQAAYGKLGDAEMVEVHRKHADSIEFELQNKLDIVTKKLERLQQRLVGVGAESSKELLLERVGAIVPRLRKERIALKLKAREENKLITSLEKLLHEKKQLLSQGEDDLKRALASDSSEVDSSVITGSNARFELEDFKKKLVKLMGSVKAGEEMVTKEIANAKVRIRNAEDEVKELEAELQVETGALMRRMASKDRIRCFRFNTTNEALRNVVGMSSDGISTCVASAGMDGLVFDILTGACLAQAVGDPEKKHLGDPVGHQAHIVCMTYVGHYLYTGGMDAALGIWEVCDDVIGGVRCTLVKFLNDFDGAVMSVTVDENWIACGSADNSVFIFDAKTYNLIAHIISAHTRTTTCMALQSNIDMLTTGGADYHIKIWKLGSISIKTSKRKYILQTVLQAKRELGTDKLYDGHLNPITCIKQISCEIVSGDTGGRIVIWNLETESKLLRICDVHKSAVICLQFDATRIVSGDANGTICITDFATGNLIQTLHGHKAAVLDLQFDRKRMASMSADGRIRLWLWHNKNVLGANKKKYHILGPGETLRALSLRYRTSIDKLLEWNNLADSNKLYLGQKLVVQIDKSDGTTDDDLKESDTAVSVQFGKLLYENLEFASSNKAASQDVDTQWAAQKVTLLAKEYFPNLEEEDVTKNGDLEETYEEDSDSDGPYDSTVEEEEVDEEENENNGE